MTGPLLTPEAVKAAHSFERLIDDEDSRWMGTRLITERQLRGFLAAHDPERLALDFYRTLDDGTGRDLAVAKAFACWLGIGGHQSERSR